MKLFPTLKKILYSTAFAFTVTVFCLIFIYASVEEVDLLVVKSIPISHFSKLLLFSFFIGALNNFLTSSLLTRTLRLLIHFVFSVLSYYIVFLSMLGLGKNSGNTFTMISLSALIYAIIMTISYVARRGFISIYEKLCIKADIKEKIKTAEARSTAKEEDKKTLLFEEETEGIEDDTDEE